MVRSADIVVFDLHDVHIWLWLLSRKTYTEPSAHPNPVPLSAFSPSRSILKTVAVEGVFVNRASSVGRWALNDIDMANRKLDISQTPKSRQDQLGVTSGRSYHTMTHPTPRPS